MAGSFDELIEYLLREVALRGNLGATPSELQSLVTKFYSKLNIKKSSSGPDPDDEGFSGPTIDRPVLGMIWKWLTAHPDISVGDNKKNNNRSFDDIEALAFSSTDHDENQNVTPISIPTIGKSKDKAQKEPSTKAPFRIYASETSQWQALTGHGVDWKRLPKSEFQALSVIAAHGKDGILQPDLCRITGQDKRSLPKRTDALASKGYIAKRPVLIKSLRTSLCILKKFDEESIPDKEPATAQNPPSASVFKDGQFLFDNFIDYLFQNLKDKRVMLVDDLHRNLGVRGQRWEVRAIRKALEKLEVVGVIQRVKAKASSTISHDKWFRCVKLVRPPTENDYQRFHSTTGEDLDEYRKSLHSKLYPYKEQDIDDQATVDVHDPETTEDPTEVLGELAEMEDAAKEGDPTNADGEACDQGRIAPRWISEQSSENAMFDHVASAGVKGISTMAFRDRGWGTFWRRPLDVILGRVSDAWEESQPAHLRHLSIVRDTAITNGRSHYIYRTFENTEEAVKQGMTSWDALRSEKAVGTGDKANTPTHSSHEEKKLDKFGFSTGRSRFAFHPSGSTSLAKCSSAPGMVAKNQSTHDPIVMEKSTGELTVVWPVRETGALKEIILQEARAKGQKRSYVRKDTGKKLGRPRKYPEGQDPRSLKKGRPKGRPPKNKRKEKTEDQTPVNTVESRVPIDATIRDKAIDAATSRDKSVEAATPRKIAKPTTAQATIFQQMMQAKKEWEEAETERFSQWARKRAEDIAAEEVRASEAASGIPGSPPDRQGMFDLINSFNQTAAKQREMSKKKGKAPAIVASQRQSLAGQKRKTLNDDPLEQTAAESRTPKRGRPKKKAKVDSEKSSETPSQPPASDVTVATSADEDVNMTDQGSVQPLDNSLAEAAPVAEGLGLENALPASNPEGPAEERVQEIISELLRKDRPGAYMNPPQSRKAPKKPGTVPRTRSLVLVVKSKSLNILEWFKEDIPPSPLTMVSLAPKRPSPDTGDSGRKAKKPKTHEERASNEQSPAPPVTPAPPTHEQPSHVPGIWRTPVADTSGPQILHQKDGSEQPPPVPAMSTSSPTNSAPAGLQIDSHANPVDDPAALQGSESQISGHGTAPPDSREELDTGIPMVDSMAEVNGNRGSNFVPIGQEERQDEFAGVLPPGPAATDEVMADMFIGSQEARNLRSITHDNLQASGGSNTGAERQSFSMSESQGVDQSSLAATSDVLRSAEAEQPNGGTRRRKKEKKKGVTISQGSVRRARVAILVEILAKHGGMYPGDLPVVQAFQDKWKEVHGAKPDSHTIQTFLKNQLSDGRNFKRLWVTCQDQYQNGVMRYILLLPHIDSESEPVQEMAKKMQNVFPKHYVPAERYAALPNSRRGQFRTDAYRQPDGSVVAERQHEAPSTTKRTRGKQAKARPLENMEESNFPGSEADGAKRLRRLFPSKYPMLQTIGPHGKRVFKIGPSQNGPLHGNNLQNSDQWPPSQQETVDLTGADDIRATPDSDVQGPILLQQYFANVGTGAYQTPYGPTNGNSIGGPNLRMLLPRPANAPHGTPYQVVPPQAVQPESGGSSPEQSGPVGSPPEHLGSVESAPEGPPDPSVAAATSVRRKRKASHRTPKPAAKKRRVGPVNNEFKNLRPADFDPRHEIQGILTQPEQLLCTSNWTFSTEFTVVRAPQSQVNMDNLIQDGTRPVRRRKRRTAAVGAAPSFQGSPQDQLEEKMPKNLDDMLKAVPLHGGPRNHNLWADPDLAEFDYTVDLIQRWETHTRVQTRLNESIQGGLDGLKLKTPHFINCKLKAKHVTVSPPEDSQIDWDHGHIEWTLLNPPPDPEPTDLEEEWLALAKAPPVAKAPPPIAPHRTTKYATIRPKPATSSGDGALAPLIGSGPLGSQKFRQYVPGTKKARKTRLKRRPNGGECVFDEAQTKRLVLAIIAVRSLVGGLEQRINWSLLSDLFHKHPNFNLSTAKTRWNWLRRNRYAVVNEASMQFEEAFLVAYEAGEIPSMDFSPDELHKYDWNGLVDWAVKKIDINVFGTNCLPVDRATLDRMYTVDKAPVVGKKTRQNLFRSATVINPSLFRETLNDVSLEVEVFPSKKTEPTAETLSELQKAMTWCRALIAVPPDRFDPMALAQRLAGTFSRKLSDDALIQLEYDKFVSRSNEHLAETGWDYILAPTLFNQFKPSSELPRLQDALACKKAIDDHFAKVNNPNFAVADEAKSFKVPKDASPAAILVVTNLIANGRVRGVPKFPPVDHKVRRKQKRPRFTKWGFVQGGYATMHMDRRCLDFGLEIEPTNKYVFGNPLDMSAPPRPTVREGKVAPIPMWYDLNGDVVEAYWSRIVQSVMGFMVSRASITREEISLTFSTYLALWEVDLLLEWMESVGAAKRSGHGKEGWTTAEWWWCALDG